MAKSRRIIRKVSAPSQLAIDEQYWPVMLALFVLCGFLMGTVAAYLPFGARHWWQDATTWLFVIPAVTCAAVWSMRYLPSRVVRRALQVSALVGCLLHLILLIVSLESRIFGRLQPPLVREQPRRPQRDLRIVNEYQAHQLDQQNQPQPEFVRPIEAEVPDPKTEQPVERQSEQQEPVPVEKQPLPAPQIPREIRQPARERPTVAETRPRVSEQPSKLSRQVVEQRQPVPESVSALAVAAPAASASALEARGDAVQQQSARTAAQPVPMPDSRKDVSEHESPQVARRAMERAPELDSLSTPTLTRKLAQPVAVPQSDVQTGASPSIAMETRQNAPEPARTTVQQQRTASPRETQVERIASAPTAPQPTPATRREQLAPDQPQLAQTPLPVTNRQSRSTSRPDLATTAATLDARMGSVPDQSSAATDRSAGQPATAAASQPASKSQPNTTNTPSSLAGGSTALPRQASAQSSSAASAGSSASTSPAATPSVATVADRAPATDQPTAQPVGTTTNHFARSARQAAIATSTSLAETPRPVTADTGAAEPQARPSRLAMNQSLGGVAGVGQTTNLDRSPSIPGSPSTTASGSARRADATQKPPPGPALAPSSSAVVRRSLAGAERPSASLRATTADLAAAAGTDAPREVNATSGASLVRQDANATHGETTAARGTVDIDLGPTRVADAGGFERASGGGQPEINLANESSSLTRTRSGGQAPISVNTSAMADSAAAPESGQLSAAGEPTGRELSASSTNNKQVATSGASGGNLSELQPSAHAASSDGQRPQIAVARAESPQNASPGGEPGDQESTAVDDQRRGVTRSKGSSSAPAPLAGPVSVPAMMPSISAPSARSAELAAANVSESAVAKVSQTGSGPAASEDSNVPAAVTGGGSQIGQPSLRRSEATEGLAGPALPGGGTSTPTRSTPSRGIITATSAEQLTVSGMPTSSGSPRGSDVPALGGTPSPTAVGTIQRQSSPTAGAAAGDVTIDVRAQSGADLTAGSASRSSVAGDAPALGVSAVSAAIQARTDRKIPALGTAVAVIAASESTATSVPTTNAELRDASTGLGTLPATRQSAAPLHIEVASADGVGGLGEHLALDVGIPSRLATVDSVDVQAAPSRFVRQDVGGVPELNTAAVFASDAFRNRNPVRGPELPRSGPGSAGPQTEEAIELGLAYLSRRQLPDGSWTLRSTGESVQLASDTAATGLCVLAFHGAGYNHREHKYAKQVAAGIDYLVTNQKPDGDLFVPLDDVSNRSVWLYSHGIAAIALCEAYGMTHDPQLREPAQRALDFIIASQDPKGGGWRYQPGVASDTSVTGWMMMALKSGELAGLDVSRPTYDRIGRWLESAQGTGSNGHLYRYNPDAPDTDSQRHGRQPTPTMTAVGLLMRLYGGWRRDHPTMIAGAEHLQQNLPAVGTTDEPLRDTYYWYYGTQVMFHMGGSLWEEWNGRLHPLLIESQVTTGALAGSWSPASPVPDRWAPHAGRLYVTTMNLLSLEVSYRHLPLYIETGK